MIKYYPQQCIKTIAEIVVIPIAIETRFVARSPESFRGLVNDRNEARSRKLSGRLHILIPMLAFIVKQHTLYHIKCGIYQKFLFQNKLSSLKNYLCDNNEKVGQCHTF